MFILFNVQFSWYVTAILADLYNAFNGNGLPNPWVTYNERPMDEGWLWKGKLTRFKIPPFLFQNSNWEIWVILLGYAILPLMTIYINHFEKSKRARRRIEAKKTFVESEQKPKQKMEPEIAESPSEEMQESKKRPRRRRESKKQNSDEDSDKKSSNSSDKDSENKSSDEDSPKITEKSPENKTPGARGRTSVATLKFLAEAKFLQEQKKFKADWIYYFFKGRINFFLAFFIEDLTGALRCLGHWICITDLSLMR